jgi:hypothetical protein
MACPCCYQPCCRNGYPTITFTISGGTTGNPNECIVPDCGVMNGSYVFSGEDVFNGTASTRRDWTIRPSCIVDNFGTPLFIPAIVAFANFPASCNGLFQTSFTGSSGVMQIQIGDIGQGGSRAIWDIVWENLVVDQDDGCVISASYGPAEPRFFPLPGRWGDTCGGWPSGGTYGPTTVRLAASVSR